MTFAKLKALIEFHRRVQGSKFVFLFIYFQTKNENLLGLLLPGGQELLRPSVDEIWAYNQNLFFYKKDLKIANYGTLKGKNALNLILIHVKVVIFNSKSLMFFKIRQFCQIDTYQ